MKLQKEVTVDEIVIKKDCILYIIGKISKKENLCVLDLAFQKKLFLR